MSFWRSRLGRRRGAESNLDRFRRQKHLKTQLLAPAGDGRRPRRTQLRPQPPPSIPQRHASDLPLLLSAQVDLADALDTLRTAEEYSARHLATSRRTAPQRCRIAAHRHLP